MWTTLALAATLGLAPGQAGELTLSNVRPTRGILGPARGDDALRPGDSLIVGFDIDGVKTDDAGKVLYSMGIKVADSSGKVIFEQKPQNYEATNSLGGNHVPAFARVDIGLEQPAGDYTLTVTIKDRAADRSKSLEHKFKVLDNDLALVRLQVSTDPDALFPAAVVGAGQSAWVNFGAVGFARDRTSGQPNTRFSLRILDADGKPTFAKPHTTTVNKGVPAKFLALPMTFPLSLNRPGKFTVELTAKDEITGKSAKLSFPLNVLPVK